MGGKKLYATGSANRLSRKASRPRKMATKSKRQPRTMLSRRMRKKRRFLARRMARMPSQIQTTSPTRDSAIATWTAACISKESESSEKGSSTVNDRVRQRPRCAKIQCLQWLPRQHPHHGVCSHQLECRLIVNLPGKASSLRRRRRSAA